MLTHSIMSEEQIAGLDPVLTLPRVTVEVNGLRGQRYLPPGTDAAAWLDANLPAVYQGLAADWLRGQDSHRDAYTGTVHISYDANGNLTRVDLSSYVGDGNPYLSKQLSFAQAKDVLLYPDNYQIALDANNQPDLYQR